MELTINVGRYYETPTIEQVLVDLAFWISTEGPERVAPHAELRD